MQASILLDSYEYALKTVNYTVFRKIKQKGITIMEYKSRIRSIATKLFHKFKKLVEVITFKTLFTSDRKKFIGKSRQEWAKAGKSYISSIKLRQIRQN